MHKRYCILALMLVFSILIFGCADNTSKINSDEIKYLDNISNMITAKKYDEALNLKYNNNLSEESNKEELALKNYAIALKNQEIGDIMAYKKYLGNISKDYNGRLAENIKKSKSEFKIDKSKTKNSKIKNNNNFNKPSTSAATNNSSETYSSKFSVPLSNYGNYEKYRISNNIYIEFSMNGKIYTFTTMGTLDKKVYILDDNAIKMMGQGLIDDYELEQIAMLGVLYKFDDYYHCIFVAEEIPRVLICNPTKKTFKFFNGIKKDGSYRFSENHQFIRFSSR